MRTGECLQRRRGDIHAWLDAAGSEKRNTLPSPLTEVTDTAFQCFPTIFFTIASPMPLRSTSISCVR